MSRRAVAAAGLLMLLAACGGEGEDAGADAPDRSHSRSHSNGGESGSVAFGAPGRASAATRTIEVTARDPYRFEPAAVEVEAGETVRFVVTNEGEQEHEFVLGDVAYQESHGEKMAAGEMRHEGNALRLAPGATEELTWTFPETGDVLFACHVAGHYEGGMVGAISVSA